MNSELKRLGQTLRAKREELKLDLKQIQNFISIRTEYLKAIEEGTIDNYVSSIYALGFLKQYIEFLGFDMDQLMKENPAAFQMQTKPHDFSYGIGTLEIRGSVGGGIKWIPNLLWAFCIGLVMIMAYYFSKLIGLL